MTEFVIIQVRILHVTVYSDETMCTPLYESWLLDWISHIPPILSPTLKILPLAGQIPPNSTYTPGTDISLTTQTKI